MDHENLEDLLKTHPGWEILLKTNNILELFIQADECLIDGCITPNDYNLLRQYFKI